MQFRVKTLLLILLTFVTASLAAAPTGYSINSDSAGENADSLYRIDLGSGTETRIAPVTSLGEARIDVEGLAIAPDGTLYGLDDASMTLFPINPDNGVVQSSEEVRIKGLADGGGNDFGMTFACDGNLYVTSVAENMLYRMSLDGSTEPLWELDQNIGALAAYGMPVQLYGLGNGQFGDGSTDNPNIYQIDIETGATTFIGALDGVGGYAEGGLAFDDNGKLWAVTDRRENLLPAPSQVLRYDLDNKTVAEVRTLGEAGFESLAVTVPRGCQAASQDQADFKVQKQFLDGNDELPVTLNISCNSGTPLQQSITVQPNSGSLGNTEVTFTVTNFDDGALDCDVWEDTPEGYSATYECFTEGNCVTDDTACTFEGASVGQDNLCVIRNYPERVEVIVGSEWLYQDDALNIDYSVAVMLECRNFIAGDGNHQGDTMTWSWVFDNDTPPQTAIVYPVQDEEDPTECRTESVARSSAVDSMGLCEEWTPIIPGTGTLDCSVINTVFYEGIPTLGRGGLLLASLLLLLTGLVFVRRF